MYGKFTAVKSVSVAFQANRVHALIGPSGCGKSTFLRTLNRMHELVEGGWITGRVLLDGTDIYAPGAVMYHGVAGKKPPDSLMRVREDAMPPAALVGRGRYEPTFLKAIDAALAVYEEDRPQSIAEWRRHIGIPEPERRKGKARKDDGSKTRRGKAKRDGDRRPMPAWLKGAIAAGVAVVAIGGGAVYLVGGSDGPGVYVEEIDTGPKPIEGVSTSTAGAVGVTERGANQGKPILVTSYADFGRRFGGPVPEPLPGLKATWLDKVNGGEWWRFALAVKGFFDNGGQRLFVKRVVSAEAAESSQQLIRGLYLDIERPAKATDSTLILSRATGLIGLNNGRVVNLRKIDGTVSTALTVASSCGVNSCSAASSGVGNLVGRPWRSRAKERRAGPASQRARSSSEAQITARATIAWGSSSHCDGVNALR